MSRQSRMRSLLEFDRYEEDALEALRNFADASGVKPSWHEPDEEDISATIIGEVLDNAIILHTDDAKQDDPIDMHIVLSHDGEPKVVLNIAVLMSTLTKVARGMEI